MALASGLSFAVVAITLVAAVLHAVWNAVAHAGGTAPFVVAVVEIALGHELPVLQLAGILVISMGLVSLALEGGRLSRSALPAVGAAVATGVAIAGYTVIRRTAGDQHRDRRPHRHLFLGERFGRGRVIAATVVAAAITLVSL